MGLFPLWYSGSLVSVIKCNRSKRPITINYLNNYLNYIILQHKIHTSNILWTDVPINNVHINNIMLTLLISLFKCTGKRSHLKCRHCFPLFLHRKTPSALEMQRGEIKMRQLWLRMDKSVRHTHFRGSCHMPECILHGPWQAYACK